MKKQVKKILWFTIKHNKQNECKQETEEFASIWNDLKIRRKKETIRITWIQGCYWTDMEIFSVWVVQPKTLLVTVVILLSKLVAASSLTVPPFHSHRALFILPSVFSLSFHPVRYILRTQLCEKGEMFFHIRLPVSIWGCVVWGRWLAASRSLQGKIFSELLQMLAHTLY